MGLILLLLIHKAMPFLGVGGRGGCAPLACWVIYRKRPRFLTSEGRVWGSQGGGGVIFSLIIEPSMLLGIGVRVGECLEASSHPGSLRHRVWKIEGGL